MHLLWCFFLTAACSLNAQILNGGFDANSNFPDFWQVGPGGITPQIFSRLLTSTSPYGSNDSVTVQAYEGQYFVRLKTGVEQQYPQHSRLTQEITINALQKISGAYFFYTSDWLVAGGWPNYNDHATIKLIPYPSSGRPEIILAYRDVNSPDVGSFGAMADWATFSHTFDSNSAGSYTLEIMIEDVGDGSYPSYLCVDALKIECIYKLAGDINSDCKVNFYDFVLLANQWLSTCATVPCSADINPIPDGVVDFGDLAIMAEHWLIDCVTLDSACEPRQ